MILTNFYIRVKSNYSTLFLCCLFCYSCLIPVRSQQNLTWVPNYSRGKCEKAFHWMPGFPAKLWLARGITKQAFSKYTGQQVQIKVTTVGGLDLNYPPLVWNQPITDLECRNPWSYFASFWYFAGSWLVLNINSKTNDTERKLNSWSLQWCKNKGESTRFSYHLSLINRKEKFTFEWSFWPQVL